MAEKKSRTYWSDKARRITGGVTLLVIILYVFFWERKIRVQSLNL